MYSAKQVSRFIITYCYNKNHPVSNLKLQKILYFSWVDFYKETHEILFNDEICAWQLGPVVPEVYYEYCSYGGRAICESYNNDIDTKNSQILSEIIDRYIYKLASSLVDMTHRPGTPWSEIYCDGIGNRDTIPFELIISRECTDN